MAHKRRCWWSKNGRESTSQRLGVKIGADRKLSLVTLSFVSVVQNTIQVNVGISIKTIHYMLLQMVLLTSKKDAKTRASFQLSQMLKPK